jgi:hypothetical protein
MIEERRDLLIDRMESDFELLQLLVQYTRQTVADHLGYFGNWYIPETYPQGVCATRLTRDNGCRVMVEVRRDDLTLVLGNWKKGPDIPKKFRLDMMVFDGAITPPCTALLAIVEFKRNSNPELLTSDIRRIANILKAIPDVEKTPLGIQVLFTIHDNEAAALGDRDRLVQAIAMLPEIQCTAPWPERPQPNSIETHQGKTFYYSVFASQILVN